MQDTDTERMDTPPGGTCDGDCRHESGVRRRTGLWRVNFITGLLALIAVAAAGCSAATPAPMAPSADPEPTGVAGDATPATPVQPSDGIWVLESIDGQPVIENSFVMLNVNEDLATGFDGCNRLEDSPWMEPPSSMSMGSSRRRLGLVRRWTAPCLKA